MPVYIQTKMNPSATCRTAGVLGPVVGIIGTLQALEAIKLLVGLPSSLSGKLRLFDGKQQQWNTLQLTPSLQCQSVGKKHAYHNNDQPMEFDARRLINYFPLSTGQ